MSGEVQKVADLMANYDPSSSDADDIALEIAADPKLVAVLTKDQRRLLVLGLFDGPTPAAEEDAAMVILDKANKADLNWIIGKIGWPAFYSELDTPCVAKLRGRSGNLVGFVHTDDDADNIASIIASHSSWLKNFSVNGKVLLVRALFDGKTYSSEEADAMKILRSLYATPTALQKAVTKLTWPLLEAELDADALAELRIKTLDFTDFDPTDSFADEVALAFAQDGAALAKLSRSNRKQLVEALLDGDTGEDEEDAARDILLSEPSGSGLIKLCCDVGGWPRLFSELDGDALTEIAAAIAVKLDLEKRLLAKSLPWLYESDADIPALIAALTPEQQNALIDKLLLARQGLMAQVKGNLRRGLGLEDDFEIAFAATVDALLSHGQYQAARLGQLKYEIYYTLLVARNLYEMDYGQLVKYLPDMADGALPAEKRSAVFQVFRLFAPEFSAMAEWVGAAGDADQQARLKRFNNVKDAFILNFNAQAAPQDLLDQILAALKDIGEEVIGSIDDLRAMLAQLAKELATIVTLDNFTGAAADDNARLFINRLKSMTQGSVNILARLPLAAKQQLCAYCLDGFTGDEDEEAILNVLSVTKQASHAEYFQLLTALTMTVLDDSIQGDEWDSFLALLKCAK